MIELNTFSITARDPRSGALGVAVSTKLACVGAMCPWVRAGTGAISTQSFVNPYLGIDGLRLLGEGLSAQETLDRLIAEDVYREIRQLAIVDRGGGTAAFSGDECTQWYGHFAGDGFVVAGNMLVGEAVLTEMRRAFEESSAEALEERLVRALEAGQDAGGDRRGKQSAALYVVTTEEYGYVDIRVDDHPEPVTELRRVFEVVKHDLLPFIDQLPKRDNPGGDLTPEVAAAYRADVEATPVNGGRID
jgi:uncharacterized Ntn-hydrolase superfamily protein